MDAGSLVALFGREAGVSLALGDSRTAALAFEGRPTVQFEHDPSIDCLHCYVVIGTFPSEPKRATALAHRMLQANAFGRDTDGATLGLDAGEIIMSRRIELARADTSLLRSVVESLVVIAGRWQARLYEAEIADPSGIAVRRVSSMGLRV